MSDRQSNSRRIAINTLVLYVRMLFLMAISFFTSRVILQVLGVEDFGVYNAVGGFVALFAVLSQSLSSAASRFLTFELGRGDEEKLARVFSTTLMIHFALALVTGGVAEVVGVWFVNAKMVIPPERLAAANWVFQFSVLSFCVSLVTVPHNAAIIAHERMTAFAYISIFEGVAKLAICYLIMASDHDRLVVYALLMLIVQAICRGLFYVYCRRHFAECRLRMVYDRGLIREIAAFAGWNMVGSSAAILRNQGGNVLLNLFFGPVVNAARALANQVLHAVNTFVENFVMALRPQITKSYASGDRDYMMTLIFQGSRLSFYMLLFICLPILLNTDYLLHLWLTTVPDHSTLFVQLTLVFMMIESLSSPLITAQMATGRIRNYQLIVGGIQLLNLPVSYAVLKMGAPAESILIVAIALSVCSLCARLWMLISSIGLDVRQFLRRVVVNVALVSLAAVTVPYLLRHFLTGSFSAFLLFSLFCMACTLAAILFVGCTGAERQFVYGKLRQSLGARFGHR